MNHNQSRYKAIKGILLLGFSFFPLLTWANEALIRQNITQHFPQLGKIIAITPITPHLYEVQIGPEILYSDAQGEYLLEGRLIQTKTQTDLTQQRIDKLSGFDFKTLPFDDAIVWRNGSGANKIAVFADPNCGYCKRFERDLQKLKDVTVYTFLYPILGPDSKEKSLNIWCAKDKTKTWLNWMINNASPPRFMGSCDQQGLERNTALGEKYRVRGTPVVFFEDGFRAPGAMSLATLEKQLQASALAVKNLQSVP